eukprot:2654057-Amphidinium_carterae.1
MKEFARLKNVIASKDAKVLGGMLRCAYGIAGAGSDSCNALMLRLASSPTTRCYSLCRAPQLTQRTNIAALL